MQKQDELCRQLIHKQNELTQSIKKQDMILSLFTQKQEQLTQSIKKQDEILLQLTQKQLTGSLKKQDELLTRMNHINTLYTRLYQPDLSSQLLSLSPHPKIFLLDICSHNNIGDIAININELSNLKKWFPNHLIIPIADENVNIYLSLISSSIQSSDVIIFHGGGNLGDLWVTHEYRRRLIVQHFPNNLIIHFPQSTHFNRQEELTMSKECYAQHKNMVFCARDQRSYQFMKEHFYHNIIYRTYDIVLTYKHPFTPINANYTSDILYLFRNDKEKSSSITLEADLEKILPPNLTININDTINHSYPHITMEDQFHIYHEKLLECYQSKLIITDRLHGAIFALIVGTPVIVYDNSYKKVSAALTELRHKLPEGYLFFAEEDALTTAQVAKMLALPKNTQLPYLLLEKEFNDFAQFLTHQTE